MSSHGKTIVRDGVSLNVLDEGEGRPVLLMHGFPDSSHLWRKQIPVLVEEQMVASGRYVESDWRYERIEDASHWITPAMLSRPRSTRPTP